MPDPGTKIHAANSYFSYGVLNYDSRTRKAAQNYANSRKMENDFGFPSPPAWRPKPTRPRSPSPTRLNYRSLSPASKAEAVARGQKELMEMVKNMPETCYELSLKDLVERPVAREDAFAKEREVVRERVEGAKKNEKKPQSVDNGGFLLKMVFPVSFLGKRKKKEKKNSDAGVSARVSPRPSVSDGSVGKDWWKMGPTVETESGESSSSGGSKGSSDSSCSTRNDGEVSCWAFLLAKRGKFPE